MSFLWKLGVTFRFCGLWPVSRTEHDECRGGGLGFAQLDNVRVLFHCNEEGGRNARTDDLTFPLI